MGNKIVIISPSPYSRYTQSVLYLLERNGFEVEGVILSKLFSLDRLTREFKRDGHRLLRKIFRKLILKSAENPITSDDNIVSYMKQNDMDVVTVPKFCRMRNIDFIQTSDINSSDAEAFLEKKKPDCVLFTGGGMIRENIIKRAGRGVINCHMGILPHYRGMDVVQWPLLKGDFGNVGLTTHLMDKGVDTGDIIKKLYVEVGKFSFLGDLRNSMERQMPAFLVESCKDLLRGDVPLITQEEDDGVQYFIINHRLETYVDKVLSKHNKSQ